MSLAEYPPAQHVMRDLGIDVESHADGSARGWLVGERPATAGVVAVFVDVVAANVALPVVQPDWMATADMAVELLREADGKEIVALARPVRKGKTTLVVEVDLSDGEPLGWASVTFSVLPRREATPVVRTGLADVPRSRLAGEGGDLARPLLDAIGFEVEDIGAGVVAVPVTDYVRNSLGAMQGGIVALVGAEAAAAALGGRTLGLHVAYLSLARVGRVRSRAEIVGPGCARVELSDAERLTTVVQARVR